MVWDSSSSGNPFSLEMKLKTQNLGFKMEFINNAEYKK